MFELGAISYSLSTEDISEDGNDDIVGVVLGALDDCISKDKFNSDILEAVGGQQESNSLPFNHISEFGLRFSGIAFVKHGFCFLHKGKDFNLEFKVFVLILNDSYGFELFELGINGGFKLVKDVGNTIVLSGKLLVFLNGVDCKEADEETGEDKESHLQ